MFQLIKYTALVLLSLVIIFATGGISIYKHYCLCTGETVQSFFNRELQCEYEGNAAACCQMNNNQTLKSCCNENHDLPAKTAKCSDDMNCCDAEYSFFKTDQYDFTKPVKKSFEFVVAYQLNIDQRKNNEQDEIAILALIPENNPPPSFGIELLKSLHQLKIASPLTV